MDRRTFTKAALGSVAAMAWGASAQAQEYGWIVRPAIVLRGAGKDGSGLRK